METLLPNTINMKNQARPTTVGEIILSVHNLSKRFGGQTVLDNVSFDLNKGDVVLLRGENGSGKTTLLNILTGNLDPDSGEIRLFVDGKKEVFSWPRHWWQNINPFDHFTPERIAWEGVGRVWQDIRLFPTMTAIENVAVASPQKGENPLLALLGNGKEDMRNREKAGEWLDGLGLGDRLDSSCDKISLGQMKRVAIARAVHAGAKILFLDEPLSGLDSNGITDVLGYLKKLVNKGVITLVIVEHVFNIPLILEFATEVWTLSEGKIKEELPEDINKKIEADDSVNPQWHLKELVSESNKQIRTIDLKGGARLTTITPSGADENGELALDIENLTVKRGIRVVLENFSLKIPKGSIAFLEAPNGWGKSTLLDAIAGIHPIQSGRIFFNGKSIDNLPTDKRVHKGLSYLRTQQPIFNTLSINSHKKLSKNSEYVFNNLPDSTIKADLLSGGQKQKLMIEMLLLGADMYLLDEPLIGLDKEAILRFADRLKRMLKDSKTLFITVPERIN